MLGRARRPVEIAVVAAWLADSPNIHLIWAVLIAALGALILAERAGYVGIYSTGINQGPFKMGNAAICRLVVGTGVGLVAIAIVIGVISLRRLTGL